MLFVVRWHQRMSEKTEDKIKDFLNCFMPSQQLICATQLDALFVEEHGTRADLRL